MDDLMPLDEYEDDADGWCDCCAMHTIEEIDCGQCDCCGKPISPEELQMADELLAIIEGERPRLNKTEMRGYVRDLFAVNAAHLRQPAQSVDVAEAIRKGFMTAESCGPDNRYVLSIKFGSLDDLQAAHNALVGLTGALQEKGNG